MPRTPRGKASGGQPGNRNALKTGQHTREARTFRKQVRLQIAQAKALIAIVHTTPAQNVITRSRSSRAPGEPIFQTEKMGRPDGPGDDACG